MYSLHVSLSAFNSFTPISLTAEYFLILQRCCRRRFQLWRMSVWVGSRVAGRRISFQTSHDWACPQLPLFPTPVSQTRYTQRPRGRNSLHSCFSWILFDAQNEDGLFSELIKFHKRGWNADWDFWKKKKKINTNVFPTHIQCRKKQWKDLVTLKSVSLRQYLTLTSH